MFCLTRLSNEPIDLHIINRCKYFLNGNTAHIQQGKRQSIFDFKIISYISNLWWLIFYSYEWDAGTVKEEPGGDGIHGNRLGTEDEGAWGGAQGQ